MLVDGRISGEEFEVVDVLNGFFADVDDFCADPALAPRSEVSMRPNSGPAPLWLLSDCLLWPTD